MEEPHMETIKIQFKARFLAAAILSLTKGFQPGPRPVMLAYKLGETVRVLQGLNVYLLNKLNPYLQGGTLQEDLTESEQEEVNDILDEDLKVEIPRIQLEELESAGVKVDDLSILPFLVEHGILRADRAH